MKKLIMVAIATTAILVFAISSVTATGYDNPVTELLPQETILLINLYPENIGTKLEELYDTYAVDWLAESLTGNLEGSSLNETTYSSLIEILKNPILNFGISVGAMDTEGIPSYFIMLEMTEETYDSMIEVLSSRLVTVDSETTEIIYYVNTFDLPKLIDVSEETPISVTAYFSYKDGYLIMTEQYQEPLEAILNTDTETLANYSNYQEVANEFLEENFINTYIDINYVAENLFSAEEDDLLNAFENYGISIEQTGTGFKLQSYSTNDASILESLGLDYSQSNAIPSIYTYMPSTDPILYGETYNLSYEWQSLVKSGLFSETEIQNIQDTFMEKTGLDMEIDALPLLEQGSGLLIQNSGNSIPSLTAMSDVSAGPIKAKATVATIIDLLWSYTESEDDTYELIEEDMTTTITKEEKDLLNGTMTVFEIDLTENESENPYAIEMPENFFDLTITVGVTGDNILLISTNPEIENEYGENLTSDSSFNTLFDRENETTTSIGYLNINNLNEYLLDLFSEMEEAAGEEFQEFEQARESINNFFSFFHEFYTTSLATNDYSDFQMTLNFDFDDLVNIETYFWETTSSAETSYEMIGNSKREFDDVDAEEWYGNDVYYLATKGVVTGYPDGNFEPGSEITRAEFVTMLMRSLYEKGYFEDTCSTSWDCTWDQETLTSNEFSDVDYLDWSAPYIYTAREVEIVQGYEDGTFHPSEPITRAEAVQMLSNAMMAVTISENAQTTSIGEFQDIETGDWYYKAVSNCSYYTIVEGTSPETFEPTRAINRAESSKIIKKFLDIVETNQ